MTKRFSLALCAAAICVGGPALRAAPRVVAVASVQALRDAVAKAAPGDDIVLDDGQYVLPHKLLAAAAGRDAAPITVRAAHPGRALLLVSGPIGFEVVAPYWHFAGLDLQGICATDTQCEHAFHVVGQADGFVLRQSVLRDFNAHVKVNADPEHHLPAHGLIENNRFSDTHARHTDNPVAVVNIDNALHWVVRGNVISDFQKDGTGEDSYGLFVKGGSMAPLLERNVIICASARPALWHMVGLSLGAHGMDANLCPPHWDAHIPCDPEVTGAMVRDNVIAQCNGDGIYVNKGRDSRVISNTLISTGGIEFRYPSATGVVRGNVVTSRIFTRDGGAVQAADNVTGVGLAVGAVGAANSPPGARSSAPGPR